MARTKAQKHAPRRRQGSRLPRLLFTFDEVAEMLGVSKGTIYLAIKAGELEVINAPGTIGTHGKRITAESIEKYIEEQRA